MSPGACTFVECG